jgi:hypothetical protein
MDDVEINFEEDEKYGEDRILMDEYSIHMQTLNG